MAGNLLYYGDNLDVLRRHIGDESIDLVYLDPPFKSDQNYNVLFGERDGQQAAGQIRAFEDTWHWDKAAARQYQDLVEQGGKVSEVLQAFRLFLGANDMLAYLSMMAPRLVELRRVLKATGSLYLAPHSPVLARQVEIDQHHHTGLGCDTETDRGSAAAASCVAC